MKRHFAGLHSEPPKGDGLLEGLFLVRVDQALYRWHPQKPFFALRFSVIEPAEHLGHTISGRLYCTAKALWRLNWFLRDFEYDAELLSRDEIDDKAIVGLTGVLQTSRTTFHGRSFLNLRAFAPARDWESLTPVTVEGNGKKENGDGL